MKNYTSLLFFLSLVTVFSCDSENLEVSPAQTIDPIEKELSPKLIKMTVITDGIEHVQTFEYKSNLITRNNRPNNVFDYYYEDNKLRQVVWKRKDLSPVWSDYYSKDGDKIVKDRFNASNEVHMSQMVYESIGKDQWVITNYDKKGGYVEGIGEIKMLDSGSISYDNKFYNKDGSLRFTSSFDYSYTQIKNPLYKVFGGVNLLSQFIRFEFYEEYMPKKIEVSWATNHSRVYDYQLNDQGLPERMVMNIFNENDSLYRSETILFEYEETEE